MSRPLHTMKRFSNMPRKKWKSTNLISIASSFQLPPPNLGFNEGVLWKVLCELWITNLLGQRPRPSRGATHSTEKGKANFLLLHFCCQVDLIQNVEDIRSLFDSVDQLGGTPLQENYIVADIAERGHHREICLSQHVKFHAD